MNVYAKHKWSTAAKNRLVRLFPAVCIFSINIFKMKNTCKYLLGILETTSGENVTQLRICTAALGVTYTSSKYPLAGGWRYVEVCNWVRGWTGVSSTKRADIHSLGFPHCSTLPAKKKSEEKKNRISHIKGETKSFRSVLTFLKPTSKDLLIRYNLS